MDLEVRDRFIEYWGKYFDGADLPIVFYYSDKLVEVKLVPAAAPPPAHRCVIADLAMVRRGISRCFNVNSLGCAGAKRYFGFSRQLRNDFEYFLSCGIVGRVEGERYKKSPEIVKRMLEEAPVMEAPYPYIIFKRWDKLIAEDEPEVVIFFSPQDVISGLFTLAGFDESNIDEVQCPFGAGCGTIVLYPYLENKKEKPRCIIGMFDVSARPYVPANYLTFSAPMKKFIEMIDNMPESFLITNSWKKMHKRIIKAMKEKKEY